MTADCIDLFDNLIWPNELRR